MDDKEVFALERDVFREMVTQIERLPRNRWESMRSMVFFWMDEELKSGEERSSSPR